MGLLPAWVKVLLVVLGVGLLGGLVWYTKLGGKLATGSPTSSSLTTSVQPQQNYSNPLDKDTQYSNPFASYQNPFDALK